jgi:hypothetical protein
MAFEQTGLAAETGYWVQNSGPQMGSLISSIAAEIFLPDTEENFYTDLIEKDKVWVDALFIPLQYRIQFLLRHIYFRQSIRYGS